MFIQAEEQVAVLALVCACLLVGIRVLLDAAAERDRPLQRDRCFAVLRIQILLAHFNIIMES